MLPTRSRLAYASVLSLLSPAFSAAIGEHALVQRGAEKGFADIPDWIKNEVSNQGIDIHYAPVAKRQQPGAECYSDDWLSVLESAPVATPFCSSFIDLPAATVMDTTTEYMYETRHAGVTSC